MQNLKFLVESYQDCEINEKYFYICLYILSGDIDVLEISMDDLISFTGLTKGQIYRARSFLIKKGNLIIKNIHCIDTGKKMKTLYQLK